MEWVAIVLSWIMFFSGVWWLLGMLEKQEKNTYKVGDKAPQSLLEKSDGKPIGAFISVCPCCKRIDAIVSI